MNEVCQKSFKRPYDLKRHQVVHNSDRPFECEHCKKTFKLIKHLTRHQKVHENPPKEEKKKPEKRKRPQKDNVSLFRVGMYPKIV